MEPDDFELTRPLSVNIRPILESVAGKLTDDEIDQWFVDLETANEGRGFSSGADRGRRVGDKPYGEIAAAAEPNFAWH